MNIEHEVCFSKEACQSALQARTSCKPECRCTSPSPFRPHFARTEGEKLSAASTRHGQQTSPLRIGAHQAAQLCATGATRCIAYSKRKSDREKGSNHGNASIPKDRKVKLDLKSLKHTQIVFVNEFNFLQKRHGIIKCTF